jgi:hypothetical protein
MEILIICIGDSVRETIFHILGMHYTKRFYSISKRINWVFCEEEKLLSDTKTKV